MDTNLIIGIVAAVVIVVLLIVWGVVRGRSRKNEVVGRPAETATSPRQAGRAGEEPETVAATVDRQLSAPETEGEAASPRSEEERKPVEPTQAAPARPAAPAYDVPEKSGSRIQRLKAKLSKSSNPFGKALFNILTKDNLSESDWEDVEDTLLLADVGAEASEQLVGELRRDARITGKASPDEVRATLRDNLLDLVGRDTDRRLNVDKPDAHKPGVIIMVGVNGTGKTTTAGKLARLFVSEDKKVVMGAADTFRAAAADQLETWGARVNVPVVRSDKDGADPASVAFEAAARAKEDDADVLIIDTAGRLQNKSNLMDELGKIRRVTEKNLPVDEKTFLAGEIPLPKVMKPGVIDLGGLTAEIIEAPGHTPGSAVVYVPERKLLLSGDDWNPCTWLFFPQALGLREYRSNMRGIQQLPFEKVLCPHREALYDRWMFDDFFNALTDGNLRAAEPVNIAPYEQIDTCQATLPHDQVLVFDWAKSGL